MKNKTAKIKEFIYEKIVNHPEDISNVLANEFGFSRQTAHKHLSKEIKNGKIIKIGRTKSTKYFLVGSKKINFSCKINSELAEDKIWSKYIKPMLSEYSNNIKQIVAYGFTEMFNNAIDHSGGKNIFTEVEIKNNAIEICIIDDGIGIFKKIQEALKLESARESLLHLSKGKFTTDPSRHSGEGIFFTSRVFDSFSILSTDLYYQFKGDEWFLSKEKPESFGQGTLINMNLSLDTTRTTKEVMDRFTDQNLGFDKTIVAVSLSSDPNDPHVSRSQAKRLMMGLEKFKTVVLDFNNVNSVGQAFVDEIFRVFANENPGIKIKYVRANAEVESMIKRGLANIL